MQYDIIVQMSPLYNYKQLGVICTMTSRCMSFAQPLSPPAEDHVFIFGTLQKQKAGLPAEVIC